MADCYDQMTLESFASSEDPAMVNDVEAPSASRTTGESGLMQWTETRSHPRNDVPMTKGKACDNVDDLGQIQAGDSGHEKGGTHRSVQIFVSVMMGLEKYG